MDRAKLTAETMALQRKVADMLSAAAPEGVKFEALVIMRLTDGNESGINFTANLPTREAIFDLCYEFLAVAGGLVPSEGGGIEVYRANKTSL